MQVLLLISVIFLLVLFLFILLPVEANIIVSLFLLAITLVVTQALFTFFHSQVNSNSIANLFLLRFSVCFPLIQQYNSITWLFLLDTAFWQPLTLFWSFHPIAIRLAFCGWLLQLRFVEQPSSTDRTQI